MSLGNHPAVAAMRDNGSRMLWFIENQLRSMDPGTWIMLALVVGVLWTLVVMRPPR